MTAAPVVAVGSCGSGSPGVTTVAVGLAWVLDALMVEADADGGVLAARAGLSLHPDAPGLSALLARLADNDDPQRDVGVGQLLASGVWVAPSVTAMEPASALAGQFAGRLSEVRTRCTVPLVVDVGRLRPGSPAWLLASAADVVVVVVSPSVASIDALLGRSARLCQLGDVVVVVNGAGAFSGSEIAVELDRRRSTLRVVGVLPHDPVGADGLLAGGRGWQRRPLVTALAQLRNAFRIESVDPETVDEATVEVSS